MRSTPRQSGFTLVELLVLIGIMALLLAMLIPAVVKVREIAHRHECASNLRSIGKGFALYLQAHQNYFPTGGSSIAVPSEAVLFPRLLLSGGKPGSGMNQGWGWMYQLLPYLGYEELWALRRSPGQQHQRAGRIYFTDQLADDEIRSTLLPFYFCPSRRNPQIVDNPLSGEGAWARSDYAGNAGPFTLISNDNALFEQDQYYSTAMWRAKMWGIIVEGPLDPLTPIVVREADVAFGFQSSKVHTRDVTDGLANTLLVSEKAYNAERLGQYQFGDQHSFCHGWGPATVRTGGLPPLRDFLGPDIVQDRFGAAHPYGINALFADGSVRNIKYELPADSRIVPVWNLAMGQMSIAPLPSPPQPANSLSLTLFQRLCHVSDGTKVDMSLME